MHGEPLGRDITALDRVAGWRAVPCLCELAFGLPMNLLQSLTEMPRWKKMNQMLPQIVTNSTLDVYKWKKSPSIHFLLFVLHSGVAGASPSLRRGKVGLHPRHVDSLSQGHKETNKQSHSDSHQLTAACPGLESNSTPSCFEDTVIVNQFHNISRQKNGKVYLQKKTTSIKYD